MVVDERMYIVESCPGAAVAGGRSACASGWASSAAVGDPAAPFDIHVDPLARPLALVAHGCRSRRVERLAGQRVTVCQVRRPLSPQDPRDGARRHPEFGCEPVRSTAVTHAQLDDPGLDLGCGSGRHRVWP